MIETIIEMAFVSGFVAIFCHAANVMTDEPKMDRCHYCLEQFNHSLPDFFRHRQVCDPKPFLLEAAIETDAVLPPDDETSIAQIMDRVMVRPPDLGTLSAGPG